MSRFVEVRYHDVVCCLPALPSAFLTCRGGEPDPREGWVLTVSTRFPAGLPRLRWPAAYGGPELPPMVVHMRL